MNVAALRLRRFKLQTPSTVTTRGKTSLLFAYETSQEINAVYRDDGLGGQSECFFVIDDIPLRCLATTFLR
jgi:hypothetical protein